MKNLHRLGLLYLVISLIIDLLCLCSCGAAGFVPNAANWCEDLHVNNKEKRELGNSMMDIRIISLKTSDSKSMIVILIVVIITVNFAGRLTELSIDNFEKKITNTYLCI